MLRHWGAYLGAQTVNIYADDQKITTDFIYQKAKTKPTTQPKQTPTKQQQENNKTPLLLSFLFLVLCPTGLDEKVELPVRVGGLRTPLPAKCLATAFTLTQALSTPRSLEPSLPPEQPVLWWLRVPTHSYSQMQPWNSGDILSQNRKTPSTQWLLQWRKSDCFVGEWRHPEEEANAQKPELPNGAWVADYTGHNHKALWIRGSRSCWELTGQSWVKGNKAFLQASRRVLRSILMSLCLVSWESRQGDLSTLVFRNWNII